MQCLRQIFLGDDQLRAFQVGMAETEAAPATLSAWAVSPVEVWNVLMQQHHLLTRDQVCAQHHQAHILVACWA